MSFSSDDDSTVSGMSELLEHLENMESTMAEMVATSDRIHRRLHELEAPIAEVELRSFGVLKNLRDSPFRDATFKFAPHIRLPFLDTTKRFKFAEICAMMRKHLIAAGAVDTDGVIHLDATMKSLLETQETKITFPQLAALLRHVLI